ncbi:MAG: Do family serine endopeptidase [Bacteroidetes bacterium]|uniref:Do family serine endopeptidase n=1 Tax=Candidatus Cryptobacteroides excrementipullorum TaxID=2840761 RepID=A0A9D9NL51_9BACT|nr:Do family serine endopeptidase [Candidatus Cryptobacteroides excrementipullorum]
MKKGIIMVLLSALVGGITAYAVVKTAEPEGNKVIVSNDGAAYRTVNLAQTDYPDFTYAAESAVDAVVYVKVTAVDVRRSAPSSIFDFFFGYEGTPEKRERVGSGSGVIIRPDGYIVTNNHVVEGASKIEVTLNNNKSYEATLIGTDPATDVALIKIEAQGLPVVPFGDSDNLRLGEWVLAIGSPYDLRSTITAGIVSAKGRSMPNYKEEFKIESFIQTDAAVNPGNSGGALVNKAGELVGVNTAIISQTGSYTGYSFAIPSNIVKKICSDLIDYGSVKRALLGVTMTPVTDEIAKDLKLSSVQGVYIKEVLKGSAADEAGIREGDVLVAIDSMKVVNASDVQAKVNNFYPGDKALMTVVRDGKEKTVEVTFKGTAAENGTVDEEGGVAFYGARLKEAPQEDLDRLGIKHGVEIVSVGPGKIMDAGVSDGFIILYVNDQPVSKPQDVLDIVKKQKRSVFIEGVTSYGKPSYFGFGI